MTCGHGGQRHKPPCYMVRFGCAQILVLVPLKTVFIVFPLLHSMKSWNMTELTPPTQSRTYLLADFAGGLCSKFTVYMQKWQSFFGPPQPPHLHIRVHRADSQLIKSDYLSYCCAVMCRKTFVFKSRLKTDCLSCFIHGTIYIR